MSGTQQLNVLPPLDGPVDIQDFYKDKSVFITGGTGFMGKVLIEKLLWACEDIGNIYILIRPKRNKTIQERFQQITNLQMFDRIREKDPKILEKIVPLEGDIGELNLGLSDEDTKTLEDNVSVVVHFAATVRFNEPLTKAILMNVRGTRDVVYLARNMKKLSALIHISTLYCNPHKPIIEEKVYTDDADWRTLIKIAEQLDKNTLNHLTDKILGNQPNTYTFTKYMAENVMHEYRKELPILIFRPSIVTCSLIDPIPGWQEPNMNGQNGLPLGVLAGVIHVAYAKDYILNDYIPCDYCANGIIMSACYRGNSNIKDSLTINAGLSNIKKMPNSLLYEVSKETIKKYPFEKVLWKPVFYSTTNRPLYMLLVFLSHLLPGALLDIILKMAGVKFRFLSLYRQLYILNGVYDFFINRKWNIRTNNYSMLYSYMNEKDKDKFFMNLESIDEREAINISVIGGKRFILKEEITEEALARARKHNKMIYTIVTITKIIMYGLILWLGYKLIQYSAARYGHVIKEYIL